MTRRLIRCPRGRRGRAQRDRDGAAARGVRAIVIARTMIYGRGTGLNPNSIQVPRWSPPPKSAAPATTWVPSRTLVECPRRGSDDLYLKALAAAPAGAFYYAENGESSMREIAVAISRRLGFDGRTAPMTLAEAVAEYGEPMTLYSLGSNSRVRVVRARRELGWAPRRPSLLDEIGARLRRRGSGMMAGVARARPARPCRRAAAPPGTRARSRTARATGSEG